MIVYPWEGRAKEVKVVNLTPHEVTVRVQIWDELNDETREMEHSFPPSGQVARVKVVSEYVSSVPHVFVDGYRGFFGGIPVYRSEFGEIEELPDPEEGTVYIVSTLVAQAAAASGRKDVVAPDTSPESAIRDESGKIIAVRRFQIF